MAGTVPEGTQEQPALFAPPSISQPEPEQTSEEAAFFGDFKTEAELQAELDRLKGIEANRSQDADRIRGLESRFDAMISRPAQPQPQEPAAPAVGPRPDPINEPEKFEQWLNSRDEALRHDFDARLQTVTRRQDEVTDRSALWSEFESDYPEYQGCEELAKAAFLEETNGTFTIPADRGLFKQNIKSRMDRMKQQLGVSSSDSNPKPAPNGGGRTTGVMGPSGQRPATPKEAPPEKVKGLSEAIQDAQVNSGFY